MRSLFPLLLSVPALAQGACHDLSDLDTIAQDALAALGARGACVRVDRAGATLHERAHGAYRLTEVVPIASASKWLSAAVLMALVDQGRCSLDDRVSLYVPSFARPDKQAITLRQCFTHSSGLPGSHTAISDASITLAEAVDRIALAPMLFAPGSEFSYGGVSMHVAGRVCEIVGGRSWAQLVRDLLATPLGWTDTDFEAFGPTANPRIAGGARTSLRDYAAFVEMLRARGTYRGVRVLGDAAVDEMFSDQTSHLPVRSSPHPTGAPYGIGTWLDRRDAQGRTLQGGGAGAFGFSAWVDRERDVTGVLVIVDRLADVWPFVDRMQRLTREQLEPRGIVCRGAPSPACATPSRINGDSVPATGNGEFGFIAVGAPAGASGALAIGTGADATGTPLLDIVVHVTLAPAPILLAWRADAAGVARAALPLTAIAPGQGCGAQAVWITPGACTELRASAAIEVDVQVR